MKKIIYYFILMLFLSSNANSQIIWNLQYSGTYENLNGIYFVDANTGYAVGNNGKFLKTTNAGQTWVIKNFPVVSRNYCVFFQDSETGFVGNEDYNLYKTTDGGNTWVSKLTAAGYAPVSITFTSSTVGFLGDRYGNIQKTTNGGDNWFTLIKMYGYDAKIFFMNDLRGWGCSTWGYVQYTTNSGATFNYSYVSNDTLASIYFITSTIGYVCGDSGRVYKTTNGGQNWTKLNTGIATKLRSIYAENLSVIYAVGNAGTIIHSFDGGSNWIVENYTTNNLNFVNFLPGMLNGFATGDLGTILKASGFESSCVGSETTVVGYPFYTYYDDSRTDILFTASELLNGGVIPGNIYKIGFTVAVANSIVMNGFNVKFQYTSLSSLTSFTNSGWTTAYSGTYQVPGTGLQYINMTTPFYWNGVNNLLIEICYNNSTFTNNSTVYSSVAPNMTFHNHIDLPTGDGCVDINTGTVQATRPNICFVTQLVSGEKNIINNVPDKYSLSQNYPNPFNPTTKIKYDIPKNSYVTLKIYNILGREIKTLVNEQKAPGTYIVDFDASNLPSGTYFFKITSESFSDTKRMILLK
jgi:photosystem II stability/assembly factor-like uncharacterized protein